MKAFFLSILFLSLTFTSSAQDLMGQFIKWTYSVEKIDESHANVVFKGEITEGYHIFSLKHNPADADGTGLVPEFNFKKSPNYKLVGKPFDIGKPIKHVDDLGTSYYFEKKATYKQQIEVLTKEKFTIEFGVNFFQLCNAEGCVGPFDTEGKVKLAGFTPSETATVTAADTSDVASTADTSAAPTSVDQAPAPIQQKEKKKDSNVVIFIAGFIAGLVALLTPCMFPMIPMTVTFFTKQSKTRREGIFKALIYGASIVLIYVAFGLVFTAIMGPLGLNDLSTNVWMNLIFFSIFVLLSLIHI
jgi:thiol:disulfide interchange protein